MDIGFDERWGTEKKVTILLEPGLYTEIMYFRAIQRHSGSTITLALQNYVLLSTGFTEYIYHVRNG